MREDASYQGPTPQRRRDDARLIAVEINLQNLMNTNEKHHLQLDEDVNRLRDQSHEWLQAIEKSQAIMLNRLPVWAVTVLSVGTGAVGAMAMWIITHR